MFTVTEVTFKPRECPEIDLSGALWTPVTKSTNLVCILVHPWSVLGGSSANTQPYAETLATAHGIECLTFDLRGVGKSTGRCSYRGSSEINDVLGANDFVKAQLNAPVILVGSSAGAAIAGSACDQISDLIAYVGIGYTFGWISSLIFGCHFDAMMKARLPKLFIMGTNDEFTSVSQLTKRVTVMNGACIELIQGVGHFELETIKYAKKTGEVIAKYMLSLERGE